MMYFLSLNPMFILIPISICLLLIFFFVKNYLFLYLQASSSKVPLTFRQIKEMRRKKIDGSILVKAKLLSKQTGIELEQEQLESFYLANGNVENVTRALITAHQAKIELDFAQACAIELAGKDVYQAIQTAIKPRVLHCSASDTEDFLLETQDGKEIKISAKITIRTALTRILEGLGEEIILTRVSEQLAQEIKSNLAQTAFEHPDLLSQNLMEQALDQGTAFDILSIDLFPKKAEPFPYPKD